MTLWGMAQNFLAFDREQVLLLPPDLRDWLEPGHFALFLIDAVERLDLTAFFERYGSGSRGRPAYPPEVMVGLMLYAYAQGVRSSRVIERRCVEDVAFRVICANLLPDHSTISRFRAEHERALSELFGQVLAMCERAGLVRVGVLAIDSTKLAANASGVANRTYEQIAEEILAEAARVDAEEDALYGEKRGDELPEELADPRTRRERLAAAKRELDAEWEAQRRAQEQMHERHRADQQRPVGQRTGGRPPHQRDMSGPPPGQLNLTDIDSRPQRTARGFIQGYNAHAAVTGGQIIVAAEVTSASMDQGQLVPIVEQAREQLAAVGAGPPETVLADAGYWLSGQVAQLQSDGIKLLVPPDKDINNPRRLNRGVGCVQMRERLKSEDGARLYAQRMAMIEPVFGQTKHNRRIDRFQRRRLAAVRSEWKLIAATHNLLKLWRANQPAIA
jgi:transposase